MRTLFVVLGLVFGWIVLVLIVGALLPGSGELTSVRRGAVYLGYIAVAAFLFFYLRRGPQHRE